MAGPALRVVFCSSCGGDEEIVFSVFEELGVEVIPAAAPGAIEASPTNELIFILLDLDSEPHWRSRLQTLQAQSPRACVLACSRFGDERLWIDALEAGAFDLICRPFSRNDVRWVVENALRRHLQRLGPKPVRRETENTVHGQARIATPQSR